MALMKNKTSHFNLLQDKRLKNYFWYLAQGDLARGFSARLNYFPLFIEVEVSTNCILSCPACARSIAPKELLGQNTTLETFKKIAPLFPYARLISFVGPLGDPFLNPNFWELHKMSKESGARTAFFTNALLMNEEHIEKVFIEKTDYVFFSIDSIIPEVYEDIKKGTDYNKVIGVVRRLIHLKREFKSELPIVCMNYIIQKKNINELPKVIEFAAREGIEKVWFTGLIIHNEESIENSMFKIDYNYLSSSFKKVKILAKKLHIKIRLPQLLFPVKYRICCDPWRTMSIYYNGDVCACTHFRFSKPYYFYVENNMIRQGVINYPPLIMGNINNECVLDIWNNKKYQELRLNLKKSLAEFPCKSCYYPYGWH
jgi:MoaA/NifB/PqqE/SkfB family radical SAM enzyme